MQMIQFVSTMMVIQMKSMKVIRNMKNILIQEFQLEMESKLIEVSMMKMQTIQFVSMTMGIQMRLNQAMIQKNFSAQFVCTNSESRPIHHKLPEPWKQRSSMSEHLQSQSIAE
jgi:hypothetical protein